MPQVLATTCKKSGFIWYSCAVMTYTRERDQFYNFLYLLCVRSVNHSSKFQKQKWELLEVYVWSHANDR